MSSEEARGNLDRQFLTQAALCASLGSPFHASLLARAAEAAAEGGRVWRSLARFAAEPPKQALPRRFMAAFHRLALEVRAPDLASPPGLVGAGGGRPGRARCGCACGWWPGGEDEGTRPAGPVGRHE